MNKDRVEDENVTLESLARMVQQGFLEMAKQADLEIVKNDVKALKTDVADLKADMKEVKGDIKHLGKRMDRVEDALGLEHPVRK